MNSSETVQASCGRRLQVKLESEAYGCLVMARFNASGTRYLLLFSVFSRKFGTDEKFMGQYPDFEVKSGYWPIIFVSVDFEASGCLGI